MERMKKPKFIKEIEKFEGKERAKCGRWYIRVYGELDHKPMVELESLEIIINELHKVEEENKNLKSDLEQFSEAYKRYRDYEKEELAESCYDLEIENKKLKDEIEELKQRVEDSDRGEDYRWQRCNEAERKLLKIECFIKDKDYPYEK